MALLVQRPVHSFAAMAAISVTALNFSAVEGEPRTDVIVAAVVDQSGGGGPVTATIDWGDGTPITPGVLVADSFDRFVVQAYQDLLHRPPSTAELSSAIGLGTQSAVANLIIGSAEYRTLTVRGLYQRLLHRDADPAGLSFGLSFLGTGGSTEQLTATIAGSAEYFVARGGGTNTGFLSALYMDLLGRPIDPAGLSAFGQALNTGTTRGQVAFTIIGSTESRTLLVQGYYRQFLGREADPAGLQLFLSFLSQGGTGDQVIATIIGSLEYLQHTGATLGNYDVLGSHTYAAKGLYSVTVVFTNGTAGAGVGTGTATVGDAKVTPFGRLVSRQVLFLDRLYQDTLGRPVDPFSIGSLLPFIQQSGRIAGARALHQFGEFAVKEVSDLFNRYLGREPGKREIDELVPAVRTGGERVAAQILSSAEYFTLHQSTAEQFIGALYNDVLGRPATEQEVHGLIGLLRTQKLADQPSARLHVALKVLRLPEGRTLLINQLYMTLLGRTPTTGSVRQPGELERALMLLKRRTTWEGLADLLVGSQEYFDRATIGFSPGTEFFANLGSFIDADPNSTDKDFTASIAWGDDTSPSTGTISKVQGVFYVGGTHAYANPGIYPVSVTLSDNTIILSQVQIIGECPADVSDSVTIVRANAKFDAATRHTTQKLTITNRGTTPIAGPVYLVIDGLPFSTSLVNAIGMTVCVEPLGRPFLKLDLAAELAPGAHTTVTLDVLNPLRAKVTYRAVVCAGSGTP
jgi:PKD repeat protein